MSHSARPRWRIRLMYQPHPSRDTLFAGNPANLVAATQNIQPIHFNDLLEMRQVVWDLAQFIVDWKPDLIPFFATGGIPYLIPVMEVLRKQGCQEFIDGNHFHLFPGLTWGGSIVGETSEAYFAKSFGEVLRACRGSERLRVLVIDTTNSGNAVNKAVAACRMAFEASGLSHDSIDLKVIGIVNSSHEEAMRSSPGKKLVTGVNRMAHVLTPSGFSPASTPVDRQFVSFTPLVPESDFRFDVAYWLVGNIPTEDNAELIGIEAIHESLATKSEPRAGRLKIIYGNGEYQQGTGLGNLCGRLISLLSMRLDEMPWEKMRAIHDLPPMTDEERESLAEMKELSEGGLRLFELMSMERIEAINELAQLPRLLMDVEVYWLGTQNPPPRNIASKVRASLERSSCTANEAVKYFRIAFPELCSADPGGDASAGWWDAKIRSMPREAFAKEEQLPDYEYDDDSCDELGHSDASGNDPVLDFVVIVGGIETARQHLLDLKSSSMSLEEIRKHLDETWPVTADKAIRFTGPTNEQVAMNFVLESGGLEQAISSLEGWIEKASQGK